MKCWPLLFLLYPSLAQAHDLWLVPPARAQAGQEVLIQALQGMNFPNGEGPPKESSFAQVQVLGPKGPVPWRWVGTKNEARLLSFVPPTKGVYVVSARTSSKSISLSANDFNTYLVSDGLAAVYLKRAEDGALDQPAVEQYQKLVVAWVRVGGGRLPQPVGLRLEIVPLLNPYQSRLLPIEVRFLGRPLPNAVVGWDHPDDGPEPAGTVRTDREGRATIPVVKDGLITLRLTHMTHPKAASHEWASYWTTFTWVR